MKFKIHSLPEILFGILALICLSFIGYGVYNTYTSHSTEQPVTIGIQTDQGFLYIQPVRVGNDPNITWRIVPKPTEVPTPSNKFEFSTANTLKILDTDNKTLLIMYPPEKK